VVNLFNVLTLLARKRPATHSYIDASRLFHERAAMRHPPCFGRRVQGSRRKYIRANHSYQGANQACELAVVECGQSGPVCKQSGKVPAVIWRLLRPGTQSGQVLRRRSTALEGRQWQTLRNYNEEIEKIWEQDISGSLRGRRKS